MKRAEPCQVRDLRMRARLPCDAKDSGGTQCERTDPHDEDGHWVSRHTQFHDVLGNGYACGSIDLYLAEQCH